MTLYYFLMNQLTNYIKSPQIFQICLKHFEKHFFKPNLCVNNT